MMEPKYKNLLIEEALFEFEQFKNKITPIEQLYAWHNKYEDLINLPYYIENKEKFFNICRKTAKIIRIVTNKSIAEKAMEEYRQINLQNEEEVIRWLLKYEEKRFSFSLPFYEKIEEKSHLIKFHLFDPFDDNIFLDDLLDDTKIDEDYKKDEKSEYIIVDISGYEEVLNFFDLYLGLYVNRHVKYVEMLKNENKIDSPLSYRLSEVLKLLGLFSDIIDKKQ